MAVVWQYFTVSEKDQRFAVCNTCSIEISRGGAVRKSFNTTNLIGHLKSRHEAVYGDYLQADQKRKNEAAKKAQTPGKTQTSIDTAFEKAKQLPPDSAKAKQITNKVMEFIALDDQPFSVVEDVGFRSLIKFMEPRYTLPSRRHFAEVCLPEIHNIVATHIRELLACDIAAISFTTDIWSSDVSPVSMLSLTAQWIDKDFNLVKAVLHSQEFAGTHSASAISEAFEKMFQTWKIDKTRVHAVVRDNARNMTKAMMDSGLASFGCMAHTLQLAIHDGVFSQRSLTDVVAICRKIVGHFKHSPLAYSRLQAVQIQLGMKPKRLQQDVSTRWNSTFYMMESLLEQKRALATYAADYDLPATLSAHQWQLIENFITLLSPFEQLTREVSSSEASAADVIPSVTALRRLLSKQADTDHGVKTTKTSLLEAVNRRFDQIQYDPMFCIATYLDPRYKDRYFDEDVKQRAREILEAHLLPAAGAEDWTRDGERAHHTERKRQRSDRAGPSLHDVFEEILEENGPERTSTSVSQQLGIFLAETTIPRGESALCYWRNNHLRFPELAQMARKYLSAPCTSTESERLFSSVSHVLDEKRNRLCCDKAEMLIFVKKNMHLIKK